MKDDPSDPKHDDDIDDLLGLNSEESSEGGVDELLSVPLVEKAKPADVPPAPKLPTYYRQLPLPSNPGFRRHSLASTPRKSSNKALVATVMIVLAGFGGMSIFLWQLKPGFFTGRTPEKIEQERVAALAEREKARQLAASRCQATLKISNVPAQTEVLMKVGAAPAQIEHMPVGTRLEFVALHDNFIPKRVVLPADANWEKTPDGKPHFELAVQLDPSHKAKALSGWPPAEPGSDVGGKGPSGTVRVISSPPGAMIWLLAAEGPEAIIEQLPCDKDFDILVAGPVANRHELHVAAADFVVDTETPPPAAGVTTRLARVTNPPATIPEKK